MEQIKKILVFRTEHIGDYISSLPALRALREKFPNAKIDIVVGPWNEKLAKATPYVDKVIIFDNPLVKRDINYMEFFSFLICKFGVFLKFFRKIRKKRYDLLVAFSERKFNKMFMKLIRAKRKICINGSMVEDEHETFRCLLLLGEVGVKKILKKTVLNHSNEDGKIVRGFLKKIGGRKKILIHVISPAPYKNWPVKKLEEFLEIVSKKYKNYSFILIGAPDDRKMLEKVIGQIGNKNIFNLAGNLSLNQIPLLMKKCDLFLGIDSGPLQFAIFSDIPIVGLYGGERAESTRKRWGPFGKNDDVIRGKEMKDIRVNDLVQLLEKKIAGV